LTLGFREDFPLNIHRIDVFNSTLSTKHLQQKLLETLHEANRKEFTFEEIADPTVPGGVVIFEFGLADGDDFSFIDEAELKRALNVLGKEKLASIDFFCSIRYYKSEGEKRAALKFDYYMLRTVFGRDVLEVQVFHERGPRYVSPEDLVLFISNRVNEGSTRKILRQQQNL
jgi:hypothetical protein